MLVPADQDEGAGGDVHYLTIEQDHDQSLEGPKASFANEDKPRFIIKPMFYLNYATFFCYFMCINIQE
jgi:hypothetical protein